MLIAGPALQRRMQQIPVLNSNACGSGPYHDDPSREATAAKDLPSCTCACASINAGCNVRSCGGTTVSTCEGTVASGCNAEAEYVNLDCAPSGRICRAGGRAECIGNGAVCSMSERPRCTGSVANYCAGGRYATVDCARNRFASRCPELGASNPCVAAGTECDGNRFAGECDGTKLRLCADGAIVSVDCSALGLVSCDASASGYARCR